MSILNPIIETLSVVLRFFYGFTRDYTLAIILLTLLVKAVLHPLTRVQLRSMKAMQTLAPHMEVLRRKHKEDPKALNQEMMALYRAHNVNPMMGCLPVLVQMPVLWALFQLLVRKGLFGEATVFGIPWMRLDAAPWTKISQALPDHPEWLLLLVFPALVALTTWLQQRMSITDPQQARMLVFMPVMIGFFAVNYQVGLSVYWIVSTAAYIGEYLWVVGRPHPMIAAPPKSQTLSQAQGGPSDRQPATQDGRPLRNKQPTQVPKGKKGAKRR